MPAVISARRLRLAALALTSAFLVSACLGNGAASPSPLPPTPAATAAATPSPTPRPQAGAQQTLVVMAPEHPTRLLPGNQLNATERLLVDLLYDPLYRLDQNMQPVPELAKTLPDVSADGLTWKIPIKIDARFHDGSKLKADDVQFSLQMAASPSCPLGLELCSTVRNHLAGTERDDNLITITLTDPYAPFLTEALGRLPILSEDAVKSATDDLIDAAGRLNENRPDKVISAIWDQTSRAECADAEPPQGCRLAEHRGQLEQIFRRARLDLPSQKPYIDQTGLFDEDAYLGDLLKRLGALAQVFDSKADDKRSAALGLLDATVKPFGGGPYKLVEVTADDTYVLEANENHTRHAPEIKRIEVRIERDPAVATTRLLSGEADWVLEIGPEQVESVSAVPGFSAATRALETQFGVLFNVRPGRVYFDVNARRAFVMCLDHEGLATQLDADRHIATTPYTAQSWALPETAVAERDVKGANALLDSAGWQMATDGVRVRDGVRLSTTIAVRPTSVDLFTFAGAAAKQLSECGIELTVEELDLTGDTMLRQLLWPNDFDTLLWTRSLGPDPDSAVRVFESSRITSEDNPADENPSGFTSELIDHLVASARETLDQAERVEAYAEIQHELDTLIPYWPLWYDSAGSALSERLRGPDGRIDPSRSRYDWDVSSWSLEPASG